MSTSPLPPELQEELRKLRADLAEVHKELQRIDRLSGRMLIAEKVIVADLEITRKQVSRLADFYYHLEERLQAFVDSVTASQTTPSEKEKEE